MEIPIYALFFLVATLLIISSVFSAAETSIISASRAKLNKLKNEGSKRAAIAFDLLKNKSEIISAVVFYNNLLNILSSSLVTAFLVKTFGGEGVLFSTIIMTVLILIFGEILPKVIAWSNPEKVAINFSFLLKYSIAFSRPIVVLLSRFVSTTTKIIGLKGSLSGGEAASSIIRDEIELQHSEGKVIKQDRDMLDGVLNLRDTEVQEIMKHRKDIEGIDFDDSIDEIVEKIFTAKYTRIPVYQGNIDNVLGILHVKDFHKTIRKLAQKDIDKEKIKSILHKPNFVPASTSLKKQLMDFQKKHNHFGFIVDEYGGVMGIVTLEDIIEEIVGDIKDEHDDKRSQIEHKEDGSITVAGDYLIRDLNRELDQDIPDTSAATIAGLIINTMEGLPEKGERFILHDHEFTIQGKEDNRITIVNIMPLKTKYLVPELSDEQE